MTMNDENLGPVDEQELAAAIQELSAELGPAANQRLARGDLLDVAERTIEELRRLEGANEGLRQQIQLQLDRNPQNEQNSASEVTCDEESETRSEELTTSLDGGAPQLETSNQDVLRTSIGEAEEHASAVDGNPVSQDGSPSPDKSCP